MVEFEDVRVSPISSIPAQSQDFLNDNVISFVGSVETQKEQGRDSSTLALSSSVCEKSAYSSVVGLNCMLFEFLPIVCSQKDNTSLF